jgi:membrane-associated phospholipid phosphatase
MCLARALGLSIWVAVVAAPNLAAQPRLRPRSGAFWAAAAGVLATAALGDQRVRTFSIEHRSGIARTFANAGNEMGTGRNLIAALAVTYVGARLAHRRSTANAVLKISAGYAVSNAIVGILKPVVGRHRPDSTNDAWRFSPVSSRGEWHSFPSSHAVHAFSLATGVALASKRPWAAALGYSAATVVAWSRLYDDQHWASDVTGSAIIGLTTAATVNWGQIRISSFDCIAGSSDCNGVELSRKTFER